VLGAALGLQALNLALDTVLWLWLLAGFGIRPGLRRGIVLFMAGLAGLLLPAQLGRLVRPEELARLGHGRFADAAKAEVIQLALLVVSAFAMMAAVLAGLWNVWAAVPAALAVIAVFLCGAALGFKWVPRLSALLAPAYFFRPSTIVIACLSTASWIVAGFSLYLVLHGSVPDLSLWQTMFVAPSNSLLGSASGMPGGLGVAEGYLGAAFHALRVPSEHLALAVGAFRLITFWIWVPIGWVALTWLGRLPNAEQPAQSVEGIEDGR